MSAPPRLARRLVERSVDARLVEAVLGDLEELYAEECERAPRTARLRYWRRALGMAWHLRRRRQRPTHRGDSLMHTLGKDLLHGVRLFAAQPGYACAAVVTLALAIGANTLIFSIADVLVVKPLPFDRPESLAWLLTAGPGASNGRGVMSLPEYTVYRDEVTPLTRLAASRRRPITVRIGDEAERGLAQEVVGDLQQLWGLRMALGRRLGASDEGPGGVRVTTISHRFWMTRFGGAGDVVGRQILVDGVPHAIVGVVGSDIELGGLAEIDVWLPLAGRPEAGSWTERQWRPVGRLADGATLSAVSAQVTAIAGRLARERPDSHRDWSARAATTRDALIAAGDWVLVTLLITVVGLLLALACANVMNLLIARLMARRQELAIRTALGATRARVVRQIVTESMLIGLVGGLVGLGIAAAGLRGIHAVAVAPFFQQLVLDIRVIGFAIVLAFLAPLTFAVMPTLRVLRFDVRSTLSDSSTRTLGGRSAVRARSALVVVQVSLAMMLLVVATLVVRTMTALASVDFGYDPAPLLAAEVDVPEWKVADERAATAVHHRIVDQVADIPEVTAVAMVSGLPVIHNLPIAQFDITGRDATPRERPTAAVLVTTPRFFEVFQVPIVAGRTFAPGDAATEAAVTVVSAETARRYWGDAAQAIGAVVRVAGEAGRPALSATVVGVARDTANPDIDQPLQPMLYLLDMHRPGRRMQVVARTAAPARLASALRAAIRAVDPDLPLHQLRPVSDSVDDGFSSGRLLTGMFAGFAIVALLLAAAGLYGVVSYGVSQRTPEIALRLALGASRTTIAREVMGGTLRLTLTGVVLGTLGGFALARTMSSVLFGVSATDAPTYAGAALVSFAAATVATWLPMRRAATVDPVQSLRQA